MPRSDRDCDRSSAVLSRSCGLHSARWAISTPKTNRFAATSKNQMHAVEPLVERLGDAAVRGDALSGKRMRYRAALYALPFLPVLIARCLWATAYQRATLRTSFANYWQSYGLFVASCLALRERPGLILLTNDHSALQRPIAFAARFMGVPTAFIPHAGVMKGLPPLCFNFAFLDGLHAVRQYARYGASNTTVLLAGTPRLDAVMQRRRAEGQRLGRCPALRDDAGSSWPPS